jgi:hypothetical protein
MQTTAAREIVINPRPVQAYVEIGPCERVQEHDGHVGSYQQLNKVRHLVSAVKERAIPRCAVFRYLRSTECPARLWNCLQPSGTSKNLRLNSEIGCEYRQVVTVPRCLLYFGRRAMLSGRCLTVAGNAGLHCARNQLTFVVRRWT